MRKSQDFALRGSFNYYLDFQIKGPSPFQSCILSSSAFSKPDKKFAIAVKHQWSRIRGSRSYVLLGLNSNTYQLSAQDIGSTIELEVFPQEEGFKGTAIVSFGPILLESSIKMILEGILASGGSKFPINLLCEESGKVIKDTASLLLTCDCIRIVLNVNDREERTMKFRYCLEEPEIEMNNLDTTVFALSFRGIFEEDRLGIMRFLQENKLTEGGLCRVAVKTVTKTARDLIYLALKCFAAKSYLLDSKLVSSLDAIFSEGQLFTSKVGKGGPLGEILLEVEGLKKEVGFLIRTNKETTGEKEKLADEVRCLEKEMGETIEAYSQMLTELKTTGNFNNESVMLEMSMLGRKDEMSYRNEVKKLLEEKKRLAEKVSLMSEELDLNRHFNKNEGFFQESRIWMRNDEEKSKESPSSRDFEGLMMSLTELKARNQALENKNNEYKELLQRNGSSGNFSGNLKALEGKLQETKKLNEMLLGELSESRRKEGSGTSQQVTTLSVQYKQKCGEVAQTEAEKEVLAKEYEALKMKFALMEAELYEARAKLRDLEERKTTTGQNNGFYARFEGERGDLNNEILVLRAKSNKSELDSSELLRRKEALESQLRTMKSKCETFELENQLFRKESESFKLQERGFGSSKDEKDEKIRVAETRFLELKAKYDLLRSESEQLKATGQNLDRSFRTMERSEDSDLKHENERLKSEMKLLRLQAESATSFPQRPEGNLQENKLRSLQRLVEEGCAVNEKNLKEISQVKRENIELKTELEFMRKAAEYTKPYSPNKLNETSFIMNKTITYELEAENESLKHKLSSLEMMVSDYKTKYSVLQLENDALRKNGPKSIDTDHEIVKSRLMTNELLLSDFKARLEQAHQELNSLRNENALLKAEVEELSRNKGKALNASCANEILDRSFREGASLNRTFQMELELENEGLKKNLASIEGMLQDYKNNVRSSMEKIQSLEKLIGQMKKESKEEINGLKNENASLSAEIEELRKSQAKGFNTSALLNRSYREGSSINRTFQMELEVENEGLKKNLASIEGLLQDYKNNVRSSMEKLQSLEKLNGSLAKENKELRAGGTESCGVFESLSKTNQRLIAENQNLMEMLRKTQDEMDGLKSRSRLMDVSFFGDQDVGSLREKVAELQRENESVSAEKDKLLVELSKIMAQQL